MQEIYELIKHITSSLKSQLKEDIESMQTNTYLITTPNFEKLFNLNKPIQDVQKFVSKKEIYTTFLKEHEEEEYMSDNTQGIKKPVLVKTESKQYSCVCLNWLFIEEGVE